MRYIVGLMLVAAGVFMVMKTESVLRMFGRNSWAEAKLGYGSSPAFYKGIGLIVIFFGFMVITNLWTVPLDLLFGRG